MADETELKPCPCCGSPGVMYSAGISSNYIMCESCNLCADDGTKEHAASAWNTRATMEKADMARTLQHLIKTEGLDSAYVWLGEVATGEEPEFSRPGNEIYET